MSRAFVNLRLERLETRWMLAADAVPLDDVYTLEPDTALEVSARGGVLVNDNLGKGLGNPTAEFVAGPSHGELTFRPDGSFVYTAGEDFPGADSFTYRLAGSTSPENLATVTLGLAESLEDVVKFRVEVVDLDGNPVSSAPVGALLELRVFVEPLPDRPHIEPVLATYAVNSVGVAAEVESVFAGSSEHFLAGRRDISGGDNLSFGPDMAYWAFRHRTDAQFVPGEQRIARIAFTANEAGTLSLSAEHVNIPDDYSPNNYGMWPVWLGYENAESPLDRIEFVSYGQIDFGDSVSVQFVVSDNTPPVANGDIYHVDENGLLEVDAATGVLANDEATQIVEVTNGSQGGEVSISADGASVHYAPPSIDFIGVETFQYTALNSDGARDTATVTVQVRSRFQNPLNPLDVNDDGHVTPLDVLLGINQLNERGPRKLTADDSVTGDTQRYLDVNGDGTHSALDVLVIINRFNATAQGGAEGEFGPVVPTALASFSPSVVAAQNTASLATFSPSAATESEVIVQRQDEVLSAWTTPILEDGLVDLLASADRTRRTDGDQETERDTDFLPADALLTSVVSDAWDR